METRQMMPKMGILCLAAAMALLAGCGSPDLYSYGQYEQLIYASYAAPGKVTPEMQVEKMEQDYQKARSANKRMCPGWHAHLGSLYFRLGKMDQARQEFLTEKAEFPESAVLMDRLLASLNKP
jgi:hypothetical protein